MVRTLPAPSLRELLSECEAEGVYFDERNRLENFRANKSLCENRWPGGTIERHSLSQPLRAASSLREGAGNGLFYSTGYSLKSRVAGDFHRPYGFAPPGTKEQRFRLGIVTGRVREPTYPYNLHASLSGGTAAQH